jgi:hypothetical protein
MKRWYKKYVDVVVLVNRYGEISPLFVVVDSFKYPIDKVLEVRNAHSQVGGSGVRYRCRIQNQERNLFYEKNRWFMESLHP